MSEKWTMRMYGRTETGEVVIDEGDCPHCAFVSKYVNAKPGDVVFVCAGAGDDDVRRVETVLTFASMTGLVCQRVTAEEVEAEMRALSAGSA